MLRNDLLGQRVLRIKGFQLPQQAFTQVPRAHSDRVEVLYHGQRVIQVILRILSVLCQLFGGSRQIARSEEHTSELQSHVNLVCRLLLEKKKAPTATTRLTSRSF